jgi:hypothetical protein
VRAVPISLSDRFIERAETVRLDGDTHPLMTISSLTPSARRPLAAASDGPKSP